MVYLRGTTAIGFDRRGRNRASSVHVPRLEQLESRALLAADVVINEVMYHQQSDNTGEEFIELLNVGTEPAELQNWQFTAGVNFIFPELTLGVGEYLVVASNVETFRTVHPDVDNVVGGWTGRLANRGEGITLENANGIIANRIRYAEQGDWAIRVLDEDDNGHRGWTWRNESDGDGKSLELINPSLPNDYGHNWLSSTVVGGTPGQPNSVATSDVAPLVADLAHSPAIPGSTDEVTVTATVADEQAGVTATLFYRLDGSPDFNSVVMQDNGVGPDDVADDGTFAATIPPMPNASIVEFLSKWSMPRVTVGTCQLSSPMILLDLPTVCIRYWTMPFPTRGIRICRHELI